MCIYPRPAWISLHSQKMTSYLLPPPPKYCDYRPVPSWRISKQALYQLTYLPKSCARACAHEWACRCLWKPGVSQSPGARVTGGCEALTWVLGLELRSSARAVGAFNQSHLSSTLKGFWAAVRRIASLVAQTSVKLTILCLSFPSV